MPDPAPGAGPVPGRDLPAPSPLAGVAPEVTVVIPTRNRCASLRSTLASVLAQRDVRLEVVVVDEASADGTPEFLRELRDRRVRHLRHDEALGPSAARNAGFALATAPWVAFCDDDDLWEPGKVRAQLDELGRVVGARWSVVGSVLVTTELEIIGCQRLESPDGLLVRLLTGNVVPASGSGLLIEVALLRELGGYDEDLRESEDWDLCIRLARSSPVASVDSPRVAYRVAPGSASGSAERMLRSFRRMEDRWGALAAELGVSFDTAAYAAYVARQELTAGHGPTAARLFAHQALTLRSPRDAARALGALVAPARMRRVGASRAVRAMPPGWYGQAREWLVRLPDLSEVEVPDRPVAS